MATAADQRGVSAERSAAISPAVPLTLRHRTQASPAAEPTPQTHGKSIASLQPPQSKPQTPAAEIKRSNEVADEALPVKRGPGRPRKVVRPTAAAAAAAEATDEEIPAEAADETSHDDSSPADAVARLSVRSPVTNGRGSISQPLEILSDEDESDEAAPAAASTCRHCGYIVPGRQIEHNLRLHETACALRTPAQRQRRLVKGAAPKPAASLAPAASAAAASASPTPQARKRSNSAAAASSEGSDTKRQKHITPGKEAKSSKRSGDSGVGRKPIKSMRLLKQVGYDLDDEEHRAAAMKKRVWEVEAVRGRRFNRETLQYDYEIKWLGWPESDNTWEPARVSAL